tara:strand:- start:332 stop:487 length:156 start_codon:yes stop_codon:yes gene_type:complete
MYIYNVYIHVYKKKKSNKKRKIPLNPKNRVRMGAGISLHENGSKCPLYPMN